MKIEVKRGKFESIGIKNLSQIAHEARIQDDSVESTKEWLLRKQEIYTPSATLLAYMKEDLVGWLCVETSDSGIAEIWRWQPFITPRVDKRRVTVELLTRAIDFVKDKQQSRLEICFDGVSSDIRDKYEEMKHWYAKAGLESIGETVYLTKDLKDIQSDSYSLVLPSGYDFRSMSDIVEDQLYNCYKMAFLHSDDRFFHSLSEKHRYDDFERYLQLSATHSASTVLMKDGEIIGFTIVQIRPNEGHLAKFGIIPEFRKRGFGEKMLLKSVDDVLVHGKKQMTVAVDVTNQPALSLYMKAGFKPVDHFITHAWKKNELKSIQREFLTI